MTRLLATLVTLALAATACSSPAAPAPAPAPPAAAPAPASGLDPAHAGLGRPADLTPQAVAPARVDTVIVGQIPVVVAAPVFVAIERGYFAEQSIQIQLERFDSGAEVLTQTAAGHLNIGTSAAVGSAALNALASGVDVKILTTGHAENRARPTTTLVLRRVDGRPLTVAELRGRKAAINSVGVSTEYILSEGLRTAGLTLDDIDLQQLPFPDMVAALTNASIDAAVVTEPFIARVTQAGVGEPLTNIVHEHLQATVTWMNTRFALQNPDVVRRYMVAHLRAIRDLQGDGLLRDDLAQIVSKYTTLPVEVIKSTAPPYWDPSGKVNVESILEQQRFHIARRSVTYRDPLDIRQYIDEAFADYAAQQLGPARS